MTRIAAVMGYQRMGTHFLGAMLTSHPQIKYTGEIFRGRVPDTWAQLTEWVDRVMGGGFEVVVLDTKYNQISHWVEHLLDRHEVKVIEIKRENALRHWFSGHLHCWRGQNPGDDTIPHFTFEPETFKDIQADVRRLQVRFGYLADLTLLYEDLTSGSQNTLALSPDYSHQLCDLLGVERMILTVPETHSKEAPHDYLAHLSGVPGSLVLRYEGHLLVGG